MNKLLAVLLFVGLWVPAAVQAQQETIDTAMVNRIRDEGSNRSQIAEIAREITDVAGARLTNSPGWRRAANWIVGTLTAWGLAKVELEPWGQFGYGWEPVKTSLAMRTPYYSPMIAYAIPWTGSTDGPVSAPAYIIRHMDSSWLSTHLAEMKGKILLIEPQDTMDRPHFQADAERFSDSALASIGDMDMLTKVELNMLIPHFTGMQKLAKMIQGSGALALLSTGRGRDGTVFVQNLIGYRKKDQPMMPQLDVSKEDFMRVFRLVEDGHMVTLELQSETKLYDQDPEGHNVVGEIPGTDPGLKTQVVMLGGHLDSWTAATGATDNGAGSIVALEAIRILKTLGVRPKRTIRIALWDGEEEGLLGSFGYVRKHFGDPINMKLTPEAGKVSVYFNLDNGSGKIRGIFAQGNEKAAAIFKQWLAPFGDLGASTVTLHNTGSTDHLSFDAVGIPGFQFIQDPLDYETRTHHSNQDNYDHLVLDDLRQAAVIEAAFVYFAAMRPDMMPRKPRGAPEKFIFDDLIP